MNDSSNSFAYLRKVNGKQFEFSKFSFFGSEFTINLPVFESLLFAFAKSFLLLVKSISMSYRNIMKVENLAAFGEILFDNTSFHP